MGEQQLADDARFVTNALTRGQPRGARDDDRGAFRAHARADVIAMLESADIPTGAINDVPAVVAHPQLAARGNDGRASTHRTATSRRSCRRTIFSTRRRAWDACRRSANTRTKSSRSSAANDDAHRTQHALRARGQVGDDHQGRRERRRRGVHRSRRFRSGERERIGARERRARVQGARFRRAHPHLQNQRTRDAVCVSRHHRDRRGRGRSH